MGDLLEALRDALSDRYRLIREIGRGGMATVYLVQDLRHDRPVALKVLHPDLACSLGTDRFLREIELAARLQHPHILSVYDSGEAAGQLWFTMPFIEGESLRERLDREKQLPVEDAVRIAREAAEALDYARRQDVIHRDVKPENILLSGERALVADFGIATTIGTPAYMSPEQAAGARSLDARSDVYSLATVLWEMLAGVPPFTGEAPRPLRSVRDTVPEHVEKAVGKALSQSRADRFSSALKFSRALATPEPAVATRAAPIEQTTSYRSVALLGIGFLLGLGVLFGWMRRHPAEPAAAPATSGIKRLAVLPFDNLGDSTDGYFADGMTDEVRGKLARLRGLRVIAHRSTADYKGTSKSFQEIGRELGVDYLLVGKVRWEKSDSSRSRVRVSPELIEVAGSSIRWQEPFDAALSDVFRVQGEIATHVAQALDVAPGDPERDRLAVKPTGDLAAYDAFLRGEGMSKRLSALARADSDSAAAAYERAVALDPSFAVAWGPPVSGPFRSVLQHHSLAGVCRAGACRGPAGGRAGAERCPVPPRTGDLLRLRPTRVRKGVGAVRHRAPGQPQRRRAVVGDGDLGAAPGPVG